MLKCKFYNFTFLQNFRKMEIEIEENLNKIGEENIVYMTHLLGSSPFFYLMVVYHVTEEEYYKPEPSEPSIPPMTAEELKEKYGIDLNNPL